MSNNNNEEDDEDIYRSTELSWSSEDEGSYGDLFGSSKPTQTPVAAAVTTTPKSKAKSTSASPPVTRRSTRRSSALAKAAARSGQEQLDEKEENETGNYAKGVIGNSPQPVGLDATLKKEESRRLDVFKQPSKAVEGRNLDLEETSLVKPDSGRSVQARNQLDGVNNDQSLKQPPTNERDEAAAQEVVSETFPEEDDSDDNLFATSDTNSDDENIKDSKSAVGDSIYVRHSVDTAQRPSSSRGNKRSMIEFKEKLEGASEAGANLKLSVSMVTQLKEAQNAAVPANEAESIVEATPKRNQISDSHSCQPFAVNKNQITSAVASAAFDTSVMAAEGGNQEKQKPLDLDLNEATPMEMDATAAYASTPSATRHTNVIVTTVKTNRSGHKTTASTSQQTAESQADIPSMTPTTVEKEEIPMMQRSLTFTKVENCTEMMQIENEQNVKLSSIPRASSKVKASFVVDLVSSESESERGSRHNSLDLGHQPRKEKDHSKPRDKKSVPSGQESEDDEEVFSAFNTKRKSPSGPSRSKQFVQKKAKKIKIIVDSFKESSAMEVVSSQVVKDDRCGGLDDNESIRSDSSFALVDEYDDGISQEEEMESFMSFFGVTHEDQDPVYIGLLKEKEEKLIRDDMAKLEEEDRAGRKAIEEVIASQLKEKQNGTDRNLEKYRAEVAEHEQRDLQRLLDRYNETTSSNQKKLKNGLTIRKNGHEQEIHNAKIQHRHNASQRRLPEQIANAEWNATLQQLQVKHQRNLQEICSKGDEMKKKCDAEYKREQDKIRQQREKRDRDIDNARQRAFSKLLSNFQQLRQRCMKRHMQKMIKKKEEILRKIATFSEGRTNEKSESRSPVPRVPIQEARDANLELRPPSPVKSIPEWVQDSGCARTSAAARHKHRKGALGRIDKQLSVELHNEGLWLYTKLPHEKNDADKADSSKKGAVDDPDSSIGKRDDEFIPWGIKARTVLQSIICGELPLGYGAEKFNLSEVVAAQGGHIRCVVSDLRTSEETASNQRATAIREQEEASLADLERKSAKLSTLATEAEKNSIRADNVVKDCFNAVDTAGKEVEKSRQALQHFQTQYREYISPEGVQLKQSTNPADWPRLLKTMTQYKSDLANKIAKEEKLRVALNDAKNHHQKMLGVSRQTQKAATVAVTMLKKRKALSSRSARARSTDALEAEKASTRVKDVIAALRRTADWRRDQFNQKQTNSASSSWVQSLPDLTGPLRKSIWHKMNRRRLQIVLRPCAESLVEDLRSDVNDALRTSQAKKGVDKEALEEELLKAEQLFLLAAYPASPSDPLPSIPSSGSSDQWAEPGWYVKLDVPVDVGRPRALLPSIHPAPVLATNLCEICSAPGRQAASMIQPTFLRTLTSELSVVAKATSLAETNPSLVSDMVYAKGDPLHITDESLQLGLSFTLKATPGKPTSQQRRKSSSKDDADSVTSTSSKKGTEPVSVGTVNVVTEAKPRPPVAKSASKTERKRRNSKGEGASPKPPRRKSASSADSSSVHARNFVQQQQQQQQQQQAAAVAAAAMSARGGVYPTTHQQPNQGMDQHAAAAAAAAAQYPPYMKAMTPTPSQQSTVPPVQQLGLPPQQVAPHHQPQQQHQPHQQQLSVNTQPQLLQPQQQQFNSPIPTVTTMGGDFSTAGYSSPQQHFQQQQQQQQRLAQMRMMQQTNAAAVAAATQQQQQQMPFFAPPNSLQGNNRQQAFPAAPMTSIPRTPTGHPGSSHLPPPGTPTVRRSNPNT